jgi:hypothetical protein
VLSVIGCRAVLQQGKPPRGGSGRGAVDPGEAASYRGAPPAQREDAGDPAGSGSSSVRLAGILLMVLLLVGVALLAVSLFGGLRGPG